MIDPFPDPETSPGLSTACEVCGGEGYVYVGDTWDHSNREPSERTEPCPECGGGDDGRDYEGEAYWQQQYEEHRYD